MRLLEIEKKARGMGIKDTWKFTKQELIKVIQRNEGNNPCFQTAGKQCSQMSCCWRDDCLR